MSAESATADALPCPACGYDLRGNPHTRDCPECGCKVEVVRAKIHSDAAANVKRLKLGVLFSAGGLAFFLLSFPASVYAQLVAIPLILSLIAYALAFIQYLVAVVLIVKSAANKNRRRMLLELGLHRWALVSLILVLTSLLLVFTAAAMFFHFVQKHLRIPFL